MRPGHYVDPNGVVSVPYLQNWNAKSEVRVYSPPEAPISADDRLVGMLAGRLDRGNAGGVQRRLSSHLEETATARLCCLSPTASTSGASGRPTTPAAACSSRRLCAANTHTADASSPGPSIHSGHGPSRPRHASSHASRHAPILARIPTTSVRSPCLDASGALARARDKRSATAACPTPADATASGGQWTSTVLGRNACSSISTVVCTAARGTSARFTPATSASVPAAHAATAAVSASSPSIAAVPSSAASSAAIAVPVTSHSRRSAQQEPAQLPRRSGRGRGNRSSTLSRDPAR